ncbi:hypothetical protein [Streptomyces sp. NPDC086182]
MAVDEDAVARARAALRAAWDEVGHPRMYAAHNRWTTVRPAHAARP